MDILQPIILWMLMTSIQAFPEGYILQVTVDCAENTTYSTSVSVVSDLEIYVSLYCKDDFHLELTAPDLVHHTATVQYTGNTSSECVFNKFPNTEIYKVELEIGYGDPGSPLHMYTDEYRITCTYDDKQSTNTSAIDLEKGILAPKAVERYTGGDPESTFTLEVTDVMGNAVSGSIPLGKKLQLKAIMTAPEGNFTGAPEVGATAVGCKAVGHGVDYAILRGGCGDGVVFALNVGFTTDGNVIKSPFFSSFHLHGSAEVRYECNFTVCRSTCDGSSCYLDKNRRRRSVSEEDEDDIMGEDQGVSQQYAFAKSQSYILKEKPLQQRAHHQSHHGNPHHHLQGHITHHIESESTNLSKAEITPDIDGLQYDTPGEGSGQKLWSQTSWTSCTSNTQCDRWKSPVVGSIGIVVCTVMVALLFMRCYSEYVNTSAHIEGNRNIHM